MRVHICGSRGSTPAPGPEFVRYGGSTSCVALAHGDQLPSLVLDGGTGLQRLSAMFGGCPFQGSILLGHLHWDHTHGLPFFPAGDRTGARVDVYPPLQDGVYAAIETQFSPPNFPIGLHDFEGDWQIRPLEPGTIELEGFEVTAREIPHKGGRTFGFRVSDGSRTVAYLSDHSPVSLGDGPHGDGVIHPAALELASDADLLLHDAQYTAEEFASRRDWGHSTIDYAVRLAAAAGVRRLLLYHHDFGRTDDQLDALVAGLQHESLPIGAATEGTTVDL